MFDLSREDSKQEVEEGLDTGVFSLEQLSLS